MESSKKPNFYCRIAGCTELFVESAEHTKHKSSIVPIPTEFKTLNFIKKLGQGAFGFVFKVFDCSDKQEKALKLIPIDDSSLLDGDIDTLKTLYHQNIIRYFMSGIVGEDCAFVLMELCDYDLEEVIKKKKITNFEQQLKIFKQICKGIEYVHLRKIIHRDLKPTNIMIKEDKDTKEIEVRVTDFGTSKSLKGKSSETLVKGTPIYTPPEYISKMDNEDKIITSVKHDIFSLGIIAHQIFANGQHPFEGSKFANISNGKYTIDYTLIKKDSTIDLIIKGCLMHDPLKRFTIEEVIRLLKTAAPPPIPKAVIEAVINSKSSNSFDPADLWNNLMKDEDEKSIMTMIRKCGGASIQDVYRIIGKPIKCHGSSGIGTYDATIMKVDIGKGWLEVQWTNESYTSWKTAKLCWME